MPFTIDNLKQIDELANEARLDADWTPDVERAYKQFKQRVYTERPDILLDKFVSDQPEGERETLKKSLRPNIGEIRDLQLEIDEATTSTAVQELRKFAQEGIAAAERVDDIDVKAPLQDVPVLGSITSGATQAALEQQALIGRVFGDDAANDFIRLADTVAQNDDGFVDETLSGVARSFTSMAQVGPLGAPGFIANAAIQEANRAYTQGKDAGLQGSDLASYTLLKGGIEGVVSSVAQRIGFGGIEQNIGQLLAPGVTAFAKQFAKTAGQELPEEALIELSGLVVDKFSGVNPDALDPETISDTLLSTVAQTVLGAGLATVIQSVQSAPLRGESFKRKDPADRPTTEPAEPKVFFEGTLQEESPESPSKASEIQGPRTTTPPTEVQQDQSYGADIPGQRPKLDPEQPTFDAVGPTQETVRVTQRQYEPPPKPVQNKFMRGVKAALRRGKQDINWEIIPVSSRLYDIAPALHRRVKEYFFQRFSKEVAIFEALKPDLKAVRKSLKENPGLQARMLSEDFNVQEAPEYAREALQRVHGVYDKIGDLLVQHGLLQEKRSGWVMPRTVKDYEGLKTHLDEPVRSVIDKELGRRAAKLKRNLSPYEKSTIANNVIRGFSSDPGRGRGRHLKQRRFDVVTPETARYYDDPIVSFDRAIRENLKMLERSKFFGRDKTALTLDETSIGDYVSKLKEEGLISREGEAEATNILRHMFEFEDSGRHPAIQFIKSLGYFQTLTNIRATITQFNDIALTAFDYGPKATVAGIRLSIPQQKQMMSVVMEEIGLHDLGAEWQQPSKFDKVLNAGLQINGFILADRFGKEVRTNAALINMKEQVKRGDTGRLRRRYKDSGWLTDKEYQQLLSDLKEGRKTELIRFILFTEVSRLQPVDISELPEGYHASNETWRLRYMLKSFMLKQMNKSLRETKQRYQEGGVKPAAKHLAKLYAVWTALGLPINMAKDMLLGREISAEDLPDYLIDSLFGMFGFHRYIGGKLLTGELTALISYIAPPAIEKTERFVTDTAPEIARELLGEGESPGFEWLKLVPLLNNYFYYNTPLGQGWFDQKKRDIRKGRQQITNIVEHQNSFINYIKHPVGMMVENDDIDLAIKVINGYNTSRREHYQAEMEWWRKYGGKRPVNPRRLTLNDVRKAIERD